MNATEETRVRQLIERWAAAINAQNRAGILADHSDNMLMFDFPSTLRGIGAYDRTWDFFFADPKGPISFTPRNLEVTAGADVAFATCLIRCEGTSAGEVELRLTTGLRKMDNRWVVTHEHHSVPTVESRFKGPDARGTREDLRP
ncbi:MAG: nuclear transport factor 2 family protein [Gemmatimonadales bacterium]|nr:nuclear transport factor 2 family protein [Gemmatimonadales bacterium]MBA3554391.1 nuclear transport factor 2 family protein [Gemmatimonadales bacterium]